MFINNLYVPPTIVLTYLFGDSLSCTYYHCQILFLGCTTNFPVPHHPAFPSVSPSIIPIAENITFLSLILNFQFGSIYVINLNLPVIPYSYNSSQFVMISASSTNKFK